MHLTHLKIQFKKSFFFYLQESIWLNSLQLHQWCTILIYLLVNQTFNLFYYPQIIAKSVNHSEHFETIHRIFKDSIFNSRSLDTNLSFILISQNPPKKCSWVQNILESGIKPSSSPEKNIFSKETWLNLLVKTWDWPNSIGQRMYPTNCNRIFCNLSNQSITFPGFLV